MATEPARYESARFVAFGDAGTGDDNQHAVAEAMKSVCAQRGCDFALYMGDVVYPEGFESADDPNFVDKFTEPYEGLDIPFHIVMGNHDYGGTRGAGNEWDKLEHALAQRARDPRFLLAPTQIIDAGPVRFIGLDTNRLLYGHESEQTAWVQPWLDFDGPVIVFGHHTYRSRGKHGDAGDYSGLGPVSWVPGVKIPAGTHFQRWFDEHLCERIEMYLAGHDHNLQWLEPSCGVELVVSGAGAKVYPLDVDSDTPALFASAELGFLWAEATENELRGVIYDDEGNVLFERTVPFGGSGG